MRINAAGQEDQRLDDAGTRERTVDDHHFTVPRRNRPPEEFRLQLFTAAGLRPVAIVTQAAGEGAGPVNGAERYTEAIWRTHLASAQQPPIVIGVIDRSHSEDGHDMQLGPFYIDCAAANASAHEVVRPPDFGGRITAADLEILVGGPVDLDRGDYTAQPPPPDAVEHYRVRSVVRLPDAEIDSPACMRMPLSWHQRLLRQLIPRHGGRSCCWYHHGDWHTVSRHAIQVLRAAKATGAAREDLPSAAVALARALPITDWEFAALESLLFDTVQPEGGMYVNGRHRSRAMLDAGVRRTVIAIYRYQ